MSNEFTNNVAQKFPNTLSKEPIERPWDVAEPKSISPLRKPMDEAKRMIWQSGSTGFILSFVPR